MLFKRPAEMGVTRGDGGAKRTATEGGKSYLEEARGHGTAWHGVVGRHVAHHRAGRRSCALKHTSAVIKCGVFVCQSVKVCVCVCLSLPLHLLYSDMMHWPKYYYRGQCLHLQ